MPEYEGDIVSAGLGEVALEVCDQFCNAPIRLARAMESRSVVETNFVDLIGVRSVFTNIEDKLLGAAVIVGQFLEVTGAGKATGEG